MRLADYFVMLMLLLAALAAGINATLSMRPAPVCPEVPARTTPPTPAQAPATPVDHERVTIKLVPREAVRPSAGPASFPHARTSAQVTLTPIPALLAMNLSGSPVERLTLPIVNGRTLPVIIDRHQRHNPQRGVFSGHVEGVPCSQVIVSYCDDAITASAHVPGDGHFEIAYAGDNRYFLLEIDDDRLLPNAPPLIPNLTASANGGL